MKKYLSILFTAIFAAVFVFSTTSCSKDDTSTDTNIVGTWNLESIDVYFDNKFVETIIDEEGFISVDYAFYSAALLFADMQYIFKNNGTFSCWGIEGKYDVKGADVYINGVKNEEMSFKDGVLYITRIDDGNSIFTPSKGIYGYTSTDGKEYGYEYDGTFHTVKCIAKYLKQ